jgi:hypothetical protein
MSNILIDGNRFDFLDYESEDEFEKDVVANSKVLFGQETVYLDIKRRIGEKASYNKGIPDGYLIDFSDIKHPQLYFVENELASHDLYGHISNQISRFIASIKTSPKQIRIKLLEEIKRSPILLREINTYIEISPFDNVDELMNQLVEKTIKIIVVIDEATNDLNAVLDVYRERPDVVTLKRYLFKNKIAYIYESLHEEFQGITGKNKKDFKINTEFDTVVCAAFQDGFKRAYEDNDAWWAIRLSQKAREQLRFLAIYEKNPVMKIRHYAEIERIEPYQDSGKFKVFLKNKKKISPIELDKAKKGVAPQSPRFTTLKKLLKAKKISQLWSS